MSRRERIPNSGDAEREIGYTERMELLAEAIVVDGSLIVTVLVIVLLLLAIVYFARRI